MNKHYFKIIITLLNELSLQYNDIEQLWKAAVDQAPLKDQNISEAEITTAMEKLDKLEAYEWISDTLDFYPPVIVYARSPSNSVLEALAAYEIVCRNPDNRTILKAGYLPGGEYRAFMDATMLIKDGQINPFISVYCDRILKESEEDTIITETLSVLYTTELYKIQHITEYRNEESETIQFKNKEFIYNHLPQKGIPANRDTAKNLQAFYKDTQMHEFDHMCPICGINVTSMLIGSHIKPFRDCAHIFECADHNNGLLLCRNHDFLFDQGYFSIAEDGSLIFCEDLKKTENFESRFNFRDHYFLPERFRTYNRMQYLEYHRKVIFKG